jgi:hypothetical protein
MYQVGDAGVVTLDTTGDVLAVVAATPSAGWTVLVAESIDAYNVSVQLLAGATLVEFRANLSMGVVVTSVESREVDLTSTSLPVAVPTGGTPAGGSTATTAGAPATTVASHSGTTTPPPATTDHDDDSSGDDSTDDSTDDNSDDSSDDQHSGDGGGDDD